MRRQWLWVGALVCILTAGAGLSALDEISGTIKQILDHRAEDFASIRKDPHVVGDETDYNSRLMVAGAKQCYITIIVKPRYADSCDIFETKNRATLTAKYKTYEKALQGAAPASWMSWTVSTTKPAGESTYIGPDRAHPAAAVHWDLEGMNNDWYNLSVTFYADGYAITKSQ